MEIVSVEELTLNLCVIPAGAVCGAERKFTARTSGDANAMTVREEEIVEVTKQTQILT